MTDLDRKMSLPLMSVSVRGFSLKERQNSTSLRLKKLRWSGARERIQSLTTHPRWVTKVSKQAKACYTG
jgi:hypothetical protein